MKLIFRLLISPRIIKEVNLEKNEWLQNFCFWENGVHVVSPVLTAKDSGHYIQNKTTETLEGGGGEVIDGPLQGADSGHPTVPLSTEGRVVSSEPAERLAWANTQEVNGKGMGGLCPCQKDNVSEDVSSCYWETSPQSGSMWEQLPHWTPVDAVLTSGVRPAYNLTEKAKGS